MSSQLKARIPANFPVRPLREGDKAEDKATCGTCGRSWDDAIPTSMTPAPSARCPFEGFHDYDDDTDTQPVARSPIAWRHSDHPEGGQLLSGEHGPIGTVFTVRDTALIVRAVNEREELIACLRTALPVVESAYLDDYDKDVAQGRKSDSDNTRATFEVLQAVKAMLAKVEGE